jgi:hypothetical protein
MDSTETEELTRAYLVARLNVEKSERAVGHLARFLARRSMVLRLVTIAAGHGPADEVVTSASGRHPAIQPVPHEVAAALRELRDWRDAARLAYQRIPEAERRTLAAPGRPWSARQTPASPQLA